MSFKLFLESEEEFDQRIDSWRNFRPTMHAISPSMITKNAVDDVISVLAGSKPAATVHISILNNDPDKDLIYDRIRKIGYTKQQFPDGIVVFGPRDLVHNISDEMKLRNTAKRANDGTILNIGYHTRMGKYLGYPEDIVDSFVQRLQQKYHDEFSLDLPG